MSYNKERTEINYDTESYGKIHTENIIVWVHPKQGNLKLEQSEEWDHAVPKVDTSHDSSIIGGSMQLLSGIQELWNDHSEDFHDNEKIKLWSSLGQDVDKWQEQVRNGNTFWPAMWKTCDGFANKGIKNIYIYIYIYIDMYSKIKV